ncbi:MAG: dynamin family protein [Chloroflexota bacterium]
MAAEDSTVGTKIALEYENIRRKEYEVISELLDVLPRIGSVEEDRVAQVRDALFHADNPYLAVFVGAFSSGKSSIINALLGEGGLLRVGPTPTTDRITILRWGEDAERMASGGDVDTVFHPSPLLKKVSFVDTPGTESIFREHEDTTQKFLHRSDTVFMVMASTQAMSAKNLETLQALKQYGKNIIIVINQADLLDDEEKATLQQYVQEQSQEKLGYRPEVWLVSAMQGLQARNNGHRDIDAWHASGLHQFEQYINRQLGDIPRLRQKLQTPLQISQNASQAALNSVRQNQQVVDQYSSIAENIRTQMDTQQRAQQRNVRDAKEDIEQRFRESTERGQEAIRDMFQLSKAVNAVGRGTLELVRLGNLLRPTGDSSLRLAFENRKALEPMQALPRHVDDLAAQMEGRDLKDIDNLVSYGQTQRKLLPEAMQNKLIGDIRAPQSYNRSAMMNIRDDLASIEDEARQIEVQNLDEQLRNTVVYLAIYEIILLLFGAVIVGVLVNAPDATIVFTLVGVLAMMMLGLLFVPLRGRMIENAYASQMLRLQNRYLDLLTGATDEQIRYGMKLREDAVSPLLTLIEAQTETQNEQLKKLQSIQQQMVAIESSLADLGKRGLLGALR